MGLVLGSIRNGTYVPSLVHRVLKPRRITGNAINGLGEARFRRPTPIYHWKNVPGIEIAFKWVQEAFYFRDLLIPPFRRLLAEAIGYQKRLKAPIAPVKKEDTAENWTRRVKEFALGHEADLVGVARMRKEWLFEGFDIDLPWIVMIGVRMRPEAIATAPERTSNFEVLTQYNRGQRAAMALANWIRGQGWYAEGQCGPFGSPVNMIPAAIAAGLGQLGKHGSVINRQVGSTFRLGYVLTGLPLVADAPDDLGVDEFCMNCRLCSSECPPRAIFDTKQLVRGELKWYVDFDKCVPYFNDTFGCAICLKVCPWGRPGVAPSLAEKMLARRRKREMQGATVH